MGYIEARELARIRHELRDRLLNQRCDGADEVLGRLSDIADHYAATSPELRGEYERWRTRFALLAPAPVAA